jgi:hypothetical protein
MESQAQYHTRPDTRRPGYSRGILCFSPLDGFVVDAVTQPQPTANDTNTCGQFLQKE